MSLRAIFLLFTSFLLLPTLPSPVAGQNKEQPANPKNNVPPSTPVIRVQDDQIQLDQPLKNTRVVILPAAGLKLSKINKILSFLKPLSRNINFRIDRSLNDFDSEEFSIVIHSDKPKPVFDQIQKHCQQLGAKLVIIKQNKEKPAKVSASPYQVKDGQILSSENNPQAPIRILVRCGAQVKNRKMKKLRLFLSGFGKEYIYETLLPDSEGDQTIQVEILTNEPKSVYKQVVRQLKELGVTKTTILSSKKKNEVYPFRLVNGKIVNKNPKLKMPKSALLIVGEETLHETKVNLWDKLVVFGLTEISVEVTKKNPNQMEVLLFTDTPKEAFVEIEKILKETGAKKVSYLSTRPVWMKGTKENLKKALEKGPVLCYFMADWCLTCKALEEGPWRNFELLRLLKKKNVSVLRFNITDWRKNGIEHGINGVPKNPLVPTFAFFSKGKKTRITPLLDDTSILKMSKRFLLDEKIQPKVKHRGDTRIPYPKTLSEDY